MKNFLDKVVHHSQKHARTVHHHVKKHAKNVHTHVKRHGKWYMYGHLMAAAVIAHIMITANNGSFAANKGPVCSDVHATSNIVLDYDYTDPKKDVILNGISFDKTTYPDLVLVKKVKQLNPTPNRGELSTDRGDLANYNNINKEDPTEEQIAEYLRNNNLNNIIDGEWWKEVVLDIEFDKKMYDNNSKEDAVGEILIFERGMNSDMYVQAISKLGGKEKGNKIFLKRSDLIDAWFSINTREIGGNQKMGYWRVDLSKLGVSSLKYLRITSEPKNSGPDFKIIGLNTEKCQPKQLDKLIVVPTCSINPDIHRNREITNPNNEPVIFTWNIYRDDQQGTWVIPAEGVFTLQTDTIDWANVLRVFVDGEGHAIQASADEKCPVPQPDEKLSLYALCSPDPDNYRVWKVINTNTIPVEFFWNINQDTVCKSNKVEICHVPKGNPENEHEICVAKNAVNAHLSNGDYLGKCKQSKIIDTEIVSSWSFVTFHTPILEDDNFLNILVGDIVHDTWSSTTTMCEKQPVNDYTVEIFADKEEILPYENITYTLQYINDWPEVMQSWFIDVYLDDHVTYNLTWGEYENSTYRFDISGLSGFSSGSIVFSWMINWWLVSWDVVSLKAIISGSRDVNIQNNEALLEISIKDLLPLELSSLCSQDPSLVREWRIKNQNTIDIPIEIYVQDILFTGVVAKANEFTYITTNTVEGTNTVALRYNWSKQVEVSSEWVICPKPVSDLAVDNVDVEVLPDQIFVATMTFKNIGPNNANEVNITTDINFWSLLVDQSLQDETQEDVSEIENNDSLLLIYTGVVESTWEALLHVEIQWNIIDPNTNNNTLEVVIPSSSSSVVIEDDDLQEDMPDSDVHFAAEEVTNIQWKDVGERVDLDEEKEYQEDVIWLWCQYSDEEYEKIYFKDIQNHWAKPFVELLRINCIVKWREANLFVTDDYINRAEAIKVAVKMRGIKNTYKVKSDKYIYIGDTPMADVNNAHWAAQYVDKSYKIWLLDSLYQWSTTKRLLPEKNITRGEAVELLVKTYLLVDQGNINLDINTDTSVFNDIDQNASYASYVQYAYQREFLQWVIDWNNLNFLPNQPITRSEFAKITALIFNKYLPVYSLK